MSAESKKSSEPYPTGAAEELKKLKRQRLALWVAGVVAGTVLAVLLIYPVTIFKLLITGTISGGLAVVYMHIKHLNRKINDARQRIEDHDDLKGVFE